MYKYIHKCYVIRSTKYVVYKKKLLLLQYVNIITYETYFKFKLVYKKNNNNHP